MKTSALLAAAAALSSLAGAAGCSTYSVRKSALAPHMAPPMRSGAGLGESAAEASFGASTLVSGAPPEEGAGANAGLHIPRRELGGALRGGVTRNLDLGILWDYGLRQGAYKTNQDEPSPQNGSVWGAGFSTFYSIPSVFPGVRIGIGLDLMRYSVPYVEYRTCVEYCDAGPYTTVKHDREGINVYSLSIIPSWRSGRITLFGGGTLRNHPTVAKGEVEYGTYDDDEVEEGPTNLVVTAGAEIELVAGVRLLGMVYQPMSEDPVRYGPTIGVALTVPLARRAPPPPPRSAPLAVSGPPTISPTPTPR
ncbi:MAG TPA: hypothetical protein VK698_34030 [Kofleriaceae bacterium]|nr:hypothetical protein [Kofleriaceae bacterium]